MSRNPLVSVIIVNYNGRDYLRECLSHVLVSDYSDFEVIVVDNGSTDGSSELVKEVMKRTEKSLKLLVNSLNVGPAKARNQAVSLSCGELLAFLDNDARPDPSWLKAAGNLLNDPEVGALQCKLLLDGRDKLFDSIGSYLGDFGFLVQRVPSGRIPDIGQFDTATDIFSTKSAGMVMRRIIFDEIEGFDSDYFIYNEEMDLCWRVWTSGHRIVFAPDSVVYHKSGSTKRVAPKIADKLLYFHGSKNYILTILKNVDGGTFLRTVTLHIAGWLALSALMVLRRRPMVSMYILQGILWNLGNMKATMTKRARNAGRRKSLPKYILAHVPLRYYFNVLGRF